MATAMNNLTNEDLAEIYKKAGINPQAIEATAGETQPGTENQETVFTRTVNIGGQPRTYTGATEAEVLAQVVAAVEAQPVAVQQKPASERPKPKQFSEDELFTLGLEVQKGNVKAIDNYLEQSGFLERTLEAKYGLTPEALKAAVSATITQADKNAADDAVRRWLEQPDNDYPGGKANSKIIGYTVAAMGLSPSDPESYRKAYAQMKADQMVLPNPDAAKTDATQTKRKPTGSTAFATGAEHDTRKPATEQTPTISRAWWDKLKPFEQQQHYNELVSQGHDPAKVKFTA